MSTSYFTPNTIGVILVHKAMLPFQYAVSVFGYNGHQSTAVELKYQRLSAFWDYLLKWKETIPSQPSYPSTRERQRNLKLMNIKPADIVGPMKTGK